MIIELPIGLTHKGEIYEEVEVGGITGRVMKELSSLQGNQSEAYKAFRKGLELVVEDIPDLTGVRVDDVLGKMYYVDGQYILHEVSKEEYAGEPAEVTRSCNQCGAENTFEYDLDEIDIVTDEDMKDSAEKGFTYDEASNEFTMPFTLKHGVPTTGKTDNPDAKHGEIKLLTIDGYENTLSSSTNQKRGRGRQQATSSDLGEARFAQLYNIIHSLEHFYTTGEDHSSDKDAFTKERLEMMRRMDITKLEEMYADHLPGVQYPTVEYCNSCGAEIPVGIDPVVDFFL